LNPLKAKSLIPEVAQELDLEESLVQDVVKYYWKNIRKNLSEMSHPKIHVTNLGDFNVKHWKIDTLITNLEKWEEENTLKGNHLINARYKVAENLFTFKNLRKKLEEEQQRKHFVGLHKQTKYVKK
jgi:hypothetical protein